MDAADIFVKSQIELVRQGLFLKVFGNQKAMDKLKELASSIDAGWPGINSKAILAETHDQVGRYHECGQWCSRDDAQQQLNQLESDLPVPMEKRDLARARLMLVLQCAIVELRLRNYRGAREILDKAINIFERHVTRRGPGLHRQHIESLFYFWRGRTFALEYAFESAEADFQKALAVADLNLEDKLIKKVFSLTDEEEKTKERHRQVAAGNFVLATVLGFGLGNTKQLAGKLHESLQFLRLAVPLSRGSEDFHRRGFAHLLLGTALRSQGDDPESAKKHIKDSLILFGESEDGNVLDDTPGRVHYLHLARANHQLALHTYDQAPYTPDPPKELKAALELNKKAECYSMDPTCKSHYDPVLNYGIAVLRSLLETALENFPAGLSKAEEAILMIENRSLPAWISGWAWTAKGRALANLVPGNTPLTDQDRNNISKAQISFEKTYADENARPADRAAAHFYLSRLYSKTDDRSGARNHYDLGKKMLGKNPEYRWLRDLAKGTAHMLGRDDDGFRCVFDIEELLKEGQDKREKDLWSYISNSVVAGAREKLLKLKLKDLEESSVKTVADELGISHATLYAWLDAAGEKTPRQRKRSVPVKPSS